VVVQSRRPPRPAHSTHIHRGSAPGGTVHLLGDDLDAWRSSGTTVSQGTFQLPGPGCTFSMLVTTIWGLRLRDVVAVQQHLPPHTPWSVH
jgi:hypothetical protein